MIHNIKGGKPGSYLASEAPPCAFVHLISYPALRLVARERGTDVLILRDIVEVLAVSRR